VRSTTRGCSRSSGHTPTHFPELCNRPGCVTPCVTFRTRSGPSAVVRRWLPVSGTVSWRELRPVWNSSGSARPVWGTEGRRFKSSQPDNKNRRLGVVLGPIGWGDGQWFSEPAFGGPAERSRLLGEPGFWVETTTEEVDPQSGGVDCWAPGFG